MLFGKNMTPTGFAVRLAICLALDLADFTAGRGLFLLPWEEVPGAALLTLLFGAKGLVYVLEVIDLTEQIDAFIPTATLFGLWAGYDAGLFGKKKPLGPDAKTPRLGEPQARRLEDQR